MSDTPERCSYAVSMVKGRAGAQRHSQQLPDGELTVESLQATAYPVPPEITDEGIEAIGVLLDSCQRCGAEGAVVNTRASCAFESALGYTILNE